MNAMREPNRSRSFMPTCARLLSRICIAPPRGLARAGQQQYAPTPGPDSRRAGRAFRGRADVVGWSKCGEEVRRCRQRRRFGTQEGLAFYQAACAYLDYPHVPFGDVLSQLVRPGDTVLDIGSGIGAAALYLAPRCARVVAVEDDPRAVRYCRTTARRKARTTCRSGARRFRMPVCPCAM